MGREIERILAERGHSVELVIDEANASDLTADNLRAFLYILQQTSKSAE